MHHLYLESILDRLLLTAEGLVREHVSKVLWVLRDQFKPSSPGVSCVDSEAGADMLEPHVSVEALKEQVSLLQQQLSSLHQQFLSQQDSISMLTAEKAKFELDLNEKDAIISGLHRSGRKLGAPCKLGAQAPRDGQCSASKTLSWMGAPSRSVRILALLSFLAGLALAGWYGCGGLDRPLCSGLLSQGCHSRGSGSGQAGWSIEASSRLATERLCSALTLALRTTWLHTRPAEGDAADCPSARKSYVMGKMQCLRTGRPAPEAAAPRGDESCSNASDAAQPECSRGSPILQEEHGEGERGQEAATHGSHRPVLEDQDGWQGTGQLQTLRQTLTVQVLALQQSVDSLENEKQDLVRRLALATAASEEKEQHLRSAKESQSAERICSFTCLLLSWSYTFFRHNNVGAVALMLSAVTLASMLFLSARMLEFRMDPWIQIEKKP
jgi:hypothetical protein